MSKTINQALKELYLSLGGDPSALEDNSTVSDYIADLENGLKGLAELPAPSSDNSGKIAKVVSDGEGGYIWGAEDETSELPAPAVGDIGKIVGAVSDGESGAEYGLVSLSPTKTKIALYYDTQVSEYRFNINGTGKKTLEEMYNHLVEQGLVGDAKIREKISFELDLLQAPNLPAAYKGATGYGGNKFELDIVRADLMGGEYYSMDIAGNFLTTPKNVTVDAGIASIFAEIAYSQWSQAITA